MSGLARFRDVREGDRIAFGPNVARHVTALEHPKLYNQPGDRDDNPTMRLRARNVRGIDGNIYENANTVVTVVTDEED